jgi:diadenylate cyclase
VFDRISQLWTRLGGYNPWEVLLELALIWLVVWLIFNFLKGTRAARMFKGLGVLLIFASLLILVLTRDNAFQRIAFLYKGFLGFVALALVVIFQPELRRALVRLGEARLFRIGVGEFVPIVDEIVDAVSYMSQKKIGAIMALERDVPLGGIIDLGTKINGDVTSQMLLTIFYPGSALHDMGVVIRGGRIAAAGVQFPLYEGDDISTELGSRHRAALGISQEADCLVVVVSEETGAISLAERGELIRKLSPEALRSMLMRGLSATERRPISQEAPEPVVEEGRSVGERQPDPADEHDEQGDDTGPKSDKTAA